jgi:hypothetical protein
MPDYVNYDILLTEGKSSFDNLKNQWGPAKAAKEVPNALLSKFKALEAKLDQAITASKTNDTNSGKLVRWWRWWQWWQWQKQGLLWMWQALT